MDFDKCHDAYFKQCEAAVQNAAQQCFKSGSVVSKAAAYAFLNGGKRVRGILTLAVCSMLGGGVQEALPFAAAIEMVHTFSLVHDDLPCMDDDDMRRGKPAAHIAFGQANALLAGDLLAVEAFDLLAASGLDSTVALAACGVLAHAAGAFGMIYGQELDLKYEKQPADVAALKAVHAHKTGALLLAAAKLGILAAKQQPNAHPSVLQYAEDIGVVFQIVDDILDVTATAEQLGKPVGSDAVSGKSTFASLLGLDEARRQAQDRTENAVTLLRTVYGQDADFLCTYAERLLVRTR